MEVKRLVETLKGIILNPGLLITAALSYAFRSSRATFDGDLFTQYLTDVPHRGGRSNGQKCDGYDDE